MTGWLSRLRWHRALCALGFAFLCAGAAPAFAADEGSAKPFCPPPAAMPDLSAEAMRRAMQQAIDRGLLWRIEKDGRSSWLYGTMHLGKAEWMVPGPRVLRALMQSDTLVLELDLLDPATLAVFSAPADQAASARVLTPERQRRLDRQAAAACLPQGALARLRPILQVTTLSMLAARSEGLYGDYGSEAFLAGLARARGKPIVALETATDQLKMLGGDSEAEEGEQIDQALDELESGRTGALAGELAQAWARNDWARLDSYTQWCDCMRTPADRRALKRLLDDRNPGLADGIARLHARGQRVFGAVGALHMVGPTGLPALLAARGFRVTAVVPGP
ncbi:TraB/GumN family protein [Variovorax sp. LjRoot290]|uniref:TraB/GumN family protein n=1 Tax=unclassified Variovorax TaxID=663243 RepID=UPI003ECD41BA